MKEYDEEYRGYLIAYINDYTLTAIYEKTNWGPSPINQNAHIAVEERMPKAERVKILPDRARSTIDSVIAKKGGEAALA